MLVAVIGAGAAGLASARHLSSQKIKCEVFEMTAELGGTWVYTDKVGTDCYGYPIHTAMYKNLRINLPKEASGFPDFPIPEEGESYVSQEVVLRFLNGYADHFKLRQFIKFNHVVAEIRPFGNKWEVKALNKITQQTTIKVYDSVMVCNGHYNSPIFPTLQGVKKFNGRIIHSYNYRANTPYKNQRVLIIGGGPSGLDIGSQISEVAKQVVISHRKKLPNGEFPPNVIKKPEVLEVNNEGQVEFVDGTTFAFDSILYCTGYKYNFPFLHDDCGVTVEEFYHVKPLYKHMIHIEKPTMCFIGIPFNVCAFQMMDIQARFYCQYLNGTMELPPKELMYKEVEEDLAIRKAKGYSKSQMHKLARDQQTYFDSLAVSAKITSVLPVMCKIWNHVETSILSNFGSFRKQNFTVLNDESFVVERHTV
ncbi:senecionine N-oxygenase [Tribolium castaneum]|uniref:senecionine N-oxygenase-like n=1 Tax=Tribolium castaneum TaxID=7070 RepID=UPI0030FE2F1B